MASISTSDFRPGLKIEMDGQPFLMVFNQFVKPGKGNAFNRTKIKNLINGRVIEKTFKSGEKVGVADIPNGSEHAAVDQPEVGTARLDRQT